MLCGFIMAMALYPDAQKKAQAELDAIVGPTRLPNLDDLDKLPYINAVIKETLRWHAPTPLGLPHVTTMDDEYSGYLIPKGSVVLVNLWYEFGGEQVGNMRVDEVCRSIFHNDMTYPEPDKFMPERFLQNGKLKRSTPEDPARIGFGFGRRCVDCKSRGVWRADSLRHIILGFALGDTLRSQWYSYLSRTFSTSSTSILRLTTMASQYR